jgi:nucleotide-binding universal stress UspA family protein
MNPFSRHRSLWGCDMSYKKIVCGVTASVHSQKAALEASRLAKENLADLIFVYAVDVTFLAKGRTGSLTEDVVADSLRKVGENILDLAGKIAASQGVEPRKIVARGTVLDVLKQVVSSEKADLLVIGHEERTFFEKALVKGDVEDHILELKAQTGTEVKIIV